MSQEEQKEHLATVRVDLKLQTAKMTKRLKDFFTSESGCFLSGRSFRGTGMAEHLLNIHGLGQDLVQRLIKGTFLERLGCKVNTRTECGGSLRVPRKRDDVAASLPKAVR